MTIEKIFKKFGIITLQEASKISGVSDRALRGRISRGSLRALKIDKIWLILLKDIEKKIGIL